jgi:ribose/xylose/arabinose/galactoside ABC-type transport system permease subunit
MLSFLSMAKSSEGNGRLFVLHRGYNARMSEEQMAWIWTNIRFVVVMAAPFAVGLSWVVLRLAWNRRISLQEMLLTLTYFAFACGFVLWLTSGHVMPQPYDDYEWESVDSPQR